MLYGHLIISSLSTLQIQRKSETKQSDRQYQIHRIYKPIFCTGCTDRCCISPFEEDIISSESSEETLSPPYSGRASEPVNHLLFQNRLSYTAGESSIKFCIWLNHNMIIGDIYYHSKPLLLTSYVDNAPFDSSVAPVPLQHLMKQNCPVIITTIMQVARVIIKKDTYYPQIKLFHSANINQIVRDSVVFNLNNISCVEELSFIYKEFHL